MHILDISRIQFKIESEKGEITLMDYTMNRDTLTTSEVVFEGSQEQPVDIDFTLPDYCPDIQRILKCQIYPRITSKNISADRLDVDGTTCLKLMYADSATGKMRCFEHSIPFSSSFNLKSTPEDVVAILKPKVEYVNCRAVSPRRIDVHGAFSLCAKVFGKEKHPIISDILANDIEQKKTNVMSSDITGIGQMQFLINEVLEVSGGKPMAESIVRVNTEAFLHDYKTIANKLILKGEAIIKILYMSDSGEGSIHSMEYSIPISQIMDVNGIDEDSICNVKLDVMNENVEIREDTSGENHLFDVEIRICVVATAYIDHNLSLITDVYSTKYEIKPSYKQTEIYRLVENISDNYVEKKNIEFPEKGISTIIDTWSELCSINTKREDDKLIFKGKYNVCILGLDNEEEPFYIERMLDFTTTHNGTYDCPDTYCDIEAKLLSLSFRLTGSNEIEIKSEIIISGTVYCVYICKAISEIQVDENILKEKDNNAAVTIYYASQGESIWNIARKYCTSVDAIKIENDIEEDTVKERGMLLIPM